MNTITQLFKFHPYRISYRNSNYHCSKPIPIPQTQGVDASKPLSFSAKKQVVDSKFKPIRNIDLRINFEFALPQRQQIDYLIALANNNNLKKALEILPFLNKINPKDYKEQFRILQILLDEITDKISLVKILSSMKLNPIYFSTYLFEIRDKLPFEISVAYLNPIKKTMNSVKFKELLHRLAFYYPEKFFQELVSSPIEGPYYSSKEELVYLLQICLKENFYKGKFDSIKYYNNLIMKWNDSQYRADERSVKSPEKNLKENPWRRLIFDQFQKILLLEGVDFEDLRGMYFPKKIAKKP